MELATFDMECGTCRALKWTDLAGLVWIRNCTVQCLGKLPLQWVYIRELSFLLLSFKKQNASPCMVYDLEFKYCSCQILSLEVKCPGHFSFLWMPGHLQVLQKYWLCYFSYSKVLVMLVLRKCESITNKAICLCVSKGIIKIVSSGNFKDLGSAFESGL